VPQADNCCMGFAADCRPPSLRLRESEPTGPRCPVADGGGPHSFVHPWRTGRGGAFVPDSGLSAVPG